MKNKKNEIGNNIRELRLSRGLSQEALAAMCKFSNTTLSAYETGRKTPNLTTIAKIAKQLNVSIERLYYGDENNRFIESESDEGKKIVNSIYFLWCSGVINYYENFESETSYNEYSACGSPEGYYLHIEHYTMPIRRFIKALNEFAQNEDTYQKPEEYLEILKDSVAAEIDKIIEKSQL